MFVVYYKAPEKPIRYFHPDGMQKTIKTAWAFPETARGQAEASGLKIRSIEASPIAETMYPQGRQKNKIRW